MNMTGQHQQKTAQTRSVPGKARPLSQDVHSDGAIFPVCPDWAWLRQQFAEDPAIRFDQRIGSVTRRARGKTVYLATPYLEFDAGRENAAACAQKWAALLQTRDIPVLCPAIDAWQAETNRGAFGAMAGELPDWRGMLRTCGLVVVPPMSGWEQSRDVWAAVHKALSCGIPVYVLKHQVS